MGFPSQDNDTLYFRWTAVKGCAGRLRQGCDSMLGATSITRALVLWHAKEAALYKAELVSLCADADTNGLEAYAREQQNNPTLDISAELAIVVAAIETLQAWLVASFPNDAGELKVYQWDANTIPIDIDLTTVQRNTYQGHIQTLRNAL